MDKKKIIPAINFASQSSISALTTESGSLVRFSPLME
jgi:hypothetical protein